MSLNRDKLFPEISPDRCRFEIASLIMADVHLFNDFLLCDREMLL